MPPLGYATAMSLSQQITVSSVDLEPGNLDSETNTLATVLFYGLGLHLHKNKGQKCIPYPL